MEDVSHVCGAACAVQKYDPSCVMCGPRYLVTCKLGLFRNLIPYNTSS